MMADIDFPASPSVNDTYSFGGKTWIWNGYAWEAFTTADPFSSGQNAIINGAFNIWQRGGLFTSTENNDGAYTADRWFILSDTNDVIDVSRSTDSPDGLFDSISLDVETTNKKFGIAQIIEKANCLALINNQVTLSFWAKVSSTTNLSNIKAAIIAWSGTQDEPTHDLVSAWNSANTNPTLVTNYTYENSPTNLGVTTSWQRFSITANIDTSSTKNLAVFIWSDVTTTTAGHLLYISGAQLERGSTATRFNMHAQTINGELSSCQRYYFRNQPLKESEFGAFTFIAYLISDGLTTMAGFVNLPTTMRIAPTSVEYETLRITSYAGGPNVTISSLVTDDLFFNSPSTPYIEVETTSDFGGVGGVVVLYCDASIDAYLAFNAEF